MGGDGKIEFNITSSTSRLLTAVTIIIIVVGTVFYHLVEGLDWLDSLYLSVITLTTVGYGDLSPQTSLGKIFTIIYIFVGVGVILAFINTLVVKAGQNRKKETKEETPQEN